MEGVKKEKYLEEIKNRKKKSRVYKRFQMIGLEIAMHLEDERHKSLYIKMAKLGDSDKLLALAKNITENKKIKNKGAYFMRMAIKKIKK
ncbi:MAG: hypothetical protein PHZ25_03700 [Candidatus Pacebacteria bacterium]|nr:hypothetical protein [Candidatus Paceibacterota bacterium]